MKKNLCLWTVAAMEILAAQSAIVEQPRYKFESLRWKEHWTAVQRSLLPNTLSEISAPDNPFEKKGEPMFHYSLRDTLDTGPVTVGFGFTKRDSLLTTLNVAFTGLRDEEEAEKKIEQLIAVNTDRFGAPARDQKIPFIGRFLLWKTGGTTIQMQIVSTSVMMIYSR